MTKCILDTNTTNKNAQLEDNSIFIKNYGLFSLMHGIDKCVLENSMVMLAFCKTIQILNNCMQDLAARIKENCDKTTVFNFDSIVVNNIVSTIFIIGCGVGVIGKQQELKWYEKIKSEFIEIGRKAPLYMMSFLPLVIFQSFLKYADGMVQNRIKRGEGMNDQLNSMLQVATKSLDNITLANNAQTEAVKNIIEAQNKAMQRR